MIFLARVCLTPYIFRLTMSLSLFTVLTKLTDGRGEKEREIRTFTNIQGETRAQGMGNQFAYVFCDAVSIAVHKFVCILVVFVDFCRLSYPIAVLLLLLLLPL